MKRRGPPSAISRLSVAQLMNEIDRRRSMTGDFHRRRAELERELASVSSEIAELESLGSEGTDGRHRGPRMASGDTEAPRLRRGRGGNEQSLAARLHQLLRGRTMNVAEMAAAVKKAGHKSKSKNFRTVVGLALLSHRKMFKRVSRGQYTAK